MENLQEILQKGSIAQTSINSASSIVMKASIIEIPQMMNLIKSVLQEFLEQNVSGKKVLSIFYVSNDILYKAKNNNNEVIQLEFEKVFPQIIDSIAITQFSESTKDQLQSIKNVLRIWQSKNLVKEINLNKLTQILDEKLEEIQQNNQQQSIDFDFAVEDLIVLSERLNKKKEWRSIRKKEKSKIKELENSDNTNEEKIKSLAHLKKCDETLEEISKKIQLARNDVCNDLKINIKKLMIELSDLDKDIESLLNQLQNFHM